MCEKGSHTATGSLKKEKELRLRFFAQKSYFKAKQKLSNQTQLN